MAASSRPAAPCPECGAPLVELRVAQELQLRSCSRCDRRWWTRGDEPAALDAVLGAVATTGRRPKSAAG